MPVTGFPDSSIHKLCFRCHKWHEPHEGVVALPEATGPLSAMHNISAQLAGDPSAYRFMCHRCIRIRRLTKRIIFATFAILIVIVLILGRLHVI
jgi:hypothetical protein